MPRAIVPIAAHCIVRSTRFLGERKTGIEDLEDGPDHDEPGDDGQLAEIAAADARDEPGDAPR